MKFCSGQGEAAAAGLLGSILAEGDPATGYHLTASAAQGLTEYALAPERAAGGRRGKAPVPVTAKASRDDRRKAALKANMARRKDQARLRAAQQRDGDTPDDNDERGE